MGRQSRRDRKLPPWLQAGTQPCSTSCASGQAKPSALKQLAKGVTASTAASGTRERPQPKLSPQVHSRGAPQTEKQGLAVPSVSKSAAAKQAAAPTVLNTHR